MDLHLLHAGLVGLLLIAAWVLAVNAFVAFKRAPRARMLLVGAAFTVLAVRATWVAHGLVVGDARSDLWWGTGGDAAIALLLYTSLVR